ncbi:unnamed protein product [Parajaminaea phylloscopi]
MSKRHGADTTSAAGLAGLPPTTVPTDQLFQIQKKLQALVASLGQLNMEIAMAPSLDWPMLLSRYATLVSQTYSLSSSLTSSSSTFLPAQLDNVHRLLEEEAKTSNYFMSEEAALQAQTSEGIPAVKFRDTRNPLPKLAATPVTTMDGDKTARLGEALRTKLDPDVASRQDESIAEMAKVQRTATQTPLLDVATAGEDGLEGSASQSQLRAVLKSIAAHDELALRALRAWYHVRWRPDEDDQTYDFRMRLADDDRGELDDEDVEGEEGAGTSEGGSGMARDADGADDEEQDAGAGAMDDEEDADMEEVS